MGAEKMQALSAGPRTWLLLCLLGIAAILVIRSEIGVCACFWRACLSTCWQAMAAKSFPHGLYYLIFYGIGWLGVHLMDSGVAFSVSSMLSSIGIVSRKVLVPLSCHLPGRGTYRLPDGGAAKAASAKGRRDRDSGCAALLSDNRRGIPGYPFFPAVPWDRGRGAAHPYSSSHHGGVYSDSAYPSYDESSGGTLRLYDGAGRAVFR